MGFLDWLFGRKTPPRAASRLDPGGGDPRIRPIQARVDAGRYREAHDAVAAMRDHAGRALGIGACMGGRKDARQAFVEELPAALPDSATAWTICGTKAVHWAWEARSTRRAEEVPEEAWEVFGERMVLAQDAFLRARALAPDDPLPWALSMIIPRAAGGTLEDVGEIFDEATARDPLNEAAHLQMLAALEERWLGSHDQMFDFARTAAEASPPAHRLRLLPARAHVSRWEQIIHFDRDQDAAEGYFRRKEVREELEAVRRDVMASEDPVTIVQAANWLAFCAALGRDKAAVRALLPRTNGLVTEDPWSDLGPALASYERVRQQYGAS